MDEINYQGFIIDPTPVHFHSGEWNTDVWIRIHRGEDTSSRNFNTRDTFPTQEEDVAHSLQFGRDIIDGNVEDCTVEDL